MGSVERLAENAKNFADAYMLCANIMQPSLEGINENEHFSVCSLPICIGRSMKRIYFRKFYAQLKVV